MSTQSAVIPEQEPEASKEALEEAARFAGLNLLVKPEDEPEASENAQKEAAHIAERDLKRDDAIRTHIHRGGLVVYWTFVSVGVALFLIWSWHLGAPEKLRFLTVEQRNDLQMVLLSAVGSSFVTEASRRWLHPRKN